MTRDELRAAIDEAATYHADEGTSGYLLTESQADAIMAAAERYAEPDREALGRVRDLAEEWAAIRTMSGAPLAAAGVRLLQIVSPERFRAGELSVAGPAALPPADDRDIVGTREYVASCAGGYVTASMVRRHVRVGYGRAAVLLGRLARAGEIIGPDERARYAVPRKPA
jgi:hypothetical protein